MTQSVYHIHQKRFKGRFGPVVSRYYLLPDPMHGHTLVSEVRFRGATMTRRWKPCEETLDDKTSDPAGGAGDSYGRLDERRGGEEKDREHRKRDGSWKRLCVFTPRRLKALVTR